MKVETKDKVVLLIGAADQGELEQFAAAINARYKALRRKREIEALKEIRKGVRVRFIGQTKPKYLVGRVGTVEAVVGVKCIVQLDEPAGKFGTRLKAHLAMLKVVE